MTYATMQTRIANELHRTDLSSDGHITNAIKSAIKHYERERWYFNEATTSASLTTSASQAFYSLPDDFMKLDALTVTISSAKSDLDPMPYIEMDARDSANSNGVPRWYSVYKNQLRYFPIPDSAYVVTMSYQKRLATLSADADTNEWISDLEELIRTKAEEILCRTVIKDVDHANTLREYLRSEVYPTARAENDERLMSGKLTAHRV
jgi:hypothetical protein